MSEVRPDPDQLLARVAAEEARARRGRLRIFFGSSAGVGKTYAMLEAARAMRAAGRDVVVGYIEPHGRVETERLIEGLEKLPPLAVKYRDLTRQEFDLDAALKRHPAILLVDELAHSNLAGGEPAPRHPKRWQDVEELLDAGIDVWTTVNVQHLESLNDLVTQITGAQQRETLPDRIFDEADEIELIDLPPDDLLARLSAGKVYVADKAAAAVEHFFRKPNLMALRELALRRVADRVEAAAHAASVQAPRQRLAADRVLVAIGPDRQAEQLVRAGKRMAAALDAQWSVVYVETPELLRLSEAQRNRRIDVLRLAESLGAETVTLDGPSVASTLIEYAQTRNITRLIVGAPKVSGWRRALRRSVPRELIRSAKTFDVIVIAAVNGARGTTAGWQAGGFTGANNGSAPYDGSRTGTFARADRAGGHQGSSRAGAASYSESADSASATSQGRAATSLHARWHGDRYAWALATTGAATVIAFAMYPHFELVNLVMVYLLGVTIAGLRLGRGPAAFTAIANVIAFDFCFVPPRFNFKVTDAQYVVTFAVMLIVALVIATLMASVRQQTRVAGARERRTALLYGMSRELAATRGVDLMAPVAVRHVAEVFQSQAVVLLPGADGKLKHPSAEPADVSFRGADLAVAQWVADHNKRAGLGSDTLPAARGLYLPLKGTQSTLGVLGVLPANPRRVLLPEQSHLLETFAGQIALALERAHFAEAAESAHLAAERESLRNTLLASISHDLRTPLAVIAGASSTLADKGAKLDEPAREQLARSIEIKAGEVTALISNVLDLIRLESKQVTLRREWESIEDLVGAALRALEERLQAWTVEVRLPDDLPPVYGDALLIVQLFSNLLDNAVKYTPPGTLIQISAIVDGALVRVMVDDNGPGLPGANPAQLFNKFQRGSEEGTVVGVGLGLAICRAIVNAHGGTIEAGRSAAGGAHFEFTLPT